MKRKFKLFATIASLCLSVALMAFGVYAATQATYTATSHVSFVSQVAGQFSYEIVGGNIASGDRTGTGTTITGMETAAVEQSAGMPDVEFILTAEDNTILYYIAFESTSAQVSYAKADFTNLFNVGTENAQMEVKVGQAVGANLTAAKAALTNPLASASATIAAQNTALTQQTVPANGAYVLAVAVKLVNAQTSLTNANNYLNVVLTVNSVLPAGD